jgi:diguanylate cyclase (GGDEF)-like protein/PAS domain S-box-containing protein
LFHSRLQPTLSNPIVRENSLNRRRIQTQNLKNLLLGRSLTAKMLILSLSLGLGFALLLDTIQSKELKQTFLAQLHNELSIHAETDRELFDRHLQEFHHASRMIVAHNNYIDYVNGPFYNRKVSTSAELVHFDIPPPWMPERSLLRAFFHARFALLLDAQGRAREVYHHDTRTPDLHLPQQLLQPDVLLHKPSHNHADMTELEGKPYIISTQSLSQQERRVATLLLASPIDSRFLAGAREGRQSSTIIALMNPASGRIVASSDTSHIPEGALFDALRKDYLMIGKSFFDYGASGLRLEFGSFLATSRADEMATHIISKSSSQRTLLIAVFIGISSLLMMWVSRRVRELSHKVNRARTELFGTHPHAASRGDELHRLEQDLLHFSDEIATARRRLEEQTREKLTLSKQVAEGQQRARELWSLQSVTETLQVGIVLDSLEGLIPFNPLMDGFAEECNGLESFLLDPETESEERLIIDRDNRRRYFEINRHHALGKRGLLVRDISRQHQTEEERQIFASFPGLNPDPVLRVSNRGELLYANEAGRPLLERFALQIGDNLPQEWIVTLDQLAANGQREFQLPLDERVYAFVTAFIDGADFFYLYGHDITDRKKAEEEMLLSAAVTTNVLDAILVTDLEGDVISVNPAFTRITGYTSEEIVGRNPRLLRSMRHDAQFYDQMWHTLLENGQWKGEIWNRRKNGEIFPCIAQMSTIRSQNGTIQRFVSVFTDISERKEYEERLTHMAYFDALTRLPNRVLFMDRLRQSITLSHRNREQLALLFIDLDGFKEVNDTLGHDIGDLLLQEVARRLLESVRDSDTVSRLSGDEFVVILQEVNTQATVEQVVGKLLEGLNQPYLLNGCESRISGSIGIAISPGDGTDAEELLKRADEAMYQAKRQGKNTFHMYGKG